ncbi:MAG: IS91 family transposase [Chitinophagaceae bacterium]|nr:MAG: IS91 family transposase [Chitinophagaceae bacterium]
MKPRLEIADILREYGEGFITQKQPVCYHRKVLHAISICRTVALGGQVERCTDCGHERIAYNSCRNRHCPKCQSTNRERWIMGRREDLLDCKYFHVVFTLPEELNGFCMHYPEQMYELLFHSAKETLFAFGKDEKHLGARMGAIAVLHTWGQTLQLHPHIHMIVPAGGIDKIGNWENTKREGQYLFPVKAMSKVYQGKFMEYFRGLMKESGMEIPKDLREHLYKKDWVVYAKRPFGGVNQVIEYLGRYTHKIAISNHRLRSMTDGRVTFTYKDYRDGSSTKLMSLGANEFLRRFCLHILPKGFRKIRHYGILSSRNKPVLREQQKKMNCEPENEREKDYQSISKERLGFDVTVCPCCKKGKMETVFSFKPHAPPVIKK